MANYNITKDYDWTSIPKGSALRGMAPYVLLQSYKINSSESLNRLNSYLNLAFGDRDAESFYNKLYGDIASAEDTFFIPFFGDAVRSFSNEYGDTFQAAFLGSVDSMLMGMAKLGGEVMGTYNVGGNLKQMGDNILKGLEGMGSDVTFGKSLGDIMGNAVKQASTGYSTNPGSYIETPKLYQYAQNDSGLDVSFVLSNTINTNEYMKNWELIKKLTVINRPKRINSVAMEPPRIYSVKIPGIRFIKWAYCSGFSVNLLGTKRMIDNKLIPEGYAISMTFTSLTTEVSNFMDKI